MTEKDTEESLSMVIERILAGEKELFRLVVARYQERLLNFMLIFSKERHIAEEACQNAFVKAYTFLKQYDPNYKFENWLITIAVNEAKKILKKERNLVLTDDFSRTASSLPTVESMAEDSESIDAVRDVIRQLPFLYRSVVVLRYYNEKSFEEIGEILKANTHTVKTWLNRAKQEIRVKLTGKGHNDEK